jgi:hypothetical protein
MIRKSVFAFAVLALVATSAQARSGSSLQRGGLGFLFPDHNSFVNPGQFATSHGSALEFAYQRQNVDGGTQSVGPSFVYGNGSFGLGLSAVRGGTSLSDEGSFVDLGTAGLGFSAMKERMTIGASYSRIFNGTAVNDGVVGATLTLQGARRMGAVFGLGYRRVLGPDTQAATFGFGYAFQSSNSLELNVDFNDLDDVNDFTASGFFNLGRRWFYMGAGYSFANLSEVHSGQARVGFILGKVDVSGTIAAPFTSGGTLTYGGTLRAMF